ncbi:class I SAM-dependent methyltransferase [Pseudolabrys sp. FHR47]|uniref:class I SAM-dependent methyltransferase n=1 Tax=Pseudolabrys sp. FHR47 TaxID=2562284 RepID=UPI0010BEECF1|nr:methyltransferase [Pseudolabrys sp. FHR47]
MSATGVYGTPPSDLADVPRDATQFSPLMPGAAGLDKQPAGSLDAITLLAPPGTIERRYALALALRALKGGAPLTALAPNDRGGTRLRKELEAFGLEVNEISKRHHRIATATKVTGIDDIIAQVIADGGPRFDDEIGLWTQPGVFSWDRLDPGTHMLIERLPALSGRGADFGCGIGILARAVLASDAVTELTLVDIDRRAIECAEHNLDTQRAKFLWADLRDPHPGLVNLDFVVMNAPFHDAGQEDKGLAQAFVRRAAESLRKGGVCVMVANRHLPYEAVLKPLFKAVTPVIEQGGYKIYEARK